MTQAVPTMLELVPPGGDKWAGMQQLVKHLGITTEQVMACGDGANDLTMVRPPDPAVQLSRSYACS